MDDAKTVTGGHFVGRRVRWVDDGVPRLGQVFKVRPGLAENATRVHVVDDAWNQALGQPSRFAGSDAPLPPDVRRVERLRIHQRVTFTDRAGVERSGTVRRASPEGDVLAVSDEGYEFKGTAALFSASGDPRHDAIAAGARVEWDEPGGRTSYGVVREADDTRVEVVRDGGVMRTSGPPGAFRQSSQPLATDAPSHMDAWGVTDLRRPRAQPGGGTRFRAIIRLQGRAALQVRNEGMGAPNDYTPAKGSEQDAIGLLERDSALWAAGHGFPDFHDAMTAWIEYRVDWAPYGVLSQEFLEAREAIPSSPSP